MAVANIITDASVLRDGSWGWAGAIITDRGRAYISGRGRASVRDSNDAELAAIANTLSVAFRKGHIRAGEYILIQADNMKALSLIESALRRLPSTATPLQRRALDHILQLCANHRLRLRHVKAHVKQYHRDPRHHVHEKLDGLAKRAARRTP